MSQAKRKQLNIEQKSYIITKLNSGIPNKDLAKEFGVSHSTISTIWREREKIKSLYDRNCLEMKRARTTKYTKTDKALLKWFKCQRANNVVINGPIFQGKANEFAKRFGEDLVCTPSWIHRFRVRHGIQAWKMKGEGDAVDKGIDCKKKWRLIRCSYIRSLKSQNKYKSTPGLAKGYYMAPHLRFLDPFLKSRSYAESVSEEDDQNENEATEAFDNSNLEVTMDCVKVEEKEEEENVNEVNELYEERNDDETDSLLVERKRPHLNDEENHQTKRVKLDERKSNKDYTAIEMYLLSLAPYFENMTELQTLTFQKGVAELIENIKYQS